jgi:hypothetical protein
LESPLLRRFCRLDLGDLLLDGREQALPLGEALLDLVPARRPLGDDLLLLGARTLELSLAPFDLCPKGLHLADDASVLLRDTVDRVEPIEQLGQTARSEQNLEHILVVGGVERDKTRGERPLSFLEVRACDR